MARVLEIHIVGDLAEQALVQPMRLVLEELGQVGGAFAAKGAGIDIVVGRRHLPVMRLAALRQITDEGQLGRLVFVGLEPVETARGGFGTYCYSCILLREINPLSGSNRDWRARDCKVGTPTTYEIGTANAVLAVRARLMGVQTAGTMAARAASSQYV